MTHRSIIYDISRTISPSLAVWPGDQPFAYEHTVRMSEGGIVNLTRLTFSPHLGSHADATYHFHDEGIHPNELPLWKYLGPVHVLTIEREHGGIVPEDFAGQDLTDMQRLIVHSWVSNVPDHEWPDGFPYPTVELIDWLAEQGVVLLGLDSPSVDAFDSKDLPCHQRLRKHGIVNLENLCLAGVPDGVYDLVALPLKIADICGSPVRAILQHHRD